MASCSIFLNSSHPTTCSPSPTHMQVVSQESIHRPQPLLQRLQSLGGQPAAYQLQDGEGKGIGMGVGVGMLQRQGG